MEAVMAESQRDPRNRRSMIFTNWLDRHGVQYQSGLNVYDDGRVEFAGVWCFGPAEEHRLTGEKVG